MVWIHGGGFCAESQASPLYDLTNISKQCSDILFVSIDYRLGFLLTFRLMAKLRNSRFMTLRIST